MVSGLEPCLGRIFTPGAWHLSLTRLSTGQQWRHPIRLLKPIFARFGYLFQRPGNSSLRRPERVCGHGASQRPAARCAASPGPSLTSPEHKASFGALRFPS
jgi:hypothetical protein